mgnify:CR=1 FL=1
MERIELAEHDGHVEVVLSGRRGNAMDETFLVELETVFEGAVDRAVVLRAPGTFCTGLDLIDAAGRDRDGMRNLMSAFHRALHAVFRCPMPVVAALDGHALAGGALLALCADRRIMASGRGRFGVHGVQLGVVYPDVVIEVLHHQLDPTACEKLLFGGRLHDADHARRAGWVDEVVDGTTALRRAEEIAWELFGPAFAATKARLRRHTVEHLSSIDADGMERWLDRWFAPDTTAKRQQALRALQDREGRRPGEDPAHHG